MDDEVILIRDSDDDSCHTWIEEESESRGQLTQNHSHHITSLFVNHWVNGKVKPVKELNLAKQKYVGGLKEKQTDSPTIVFEKTDDKEMDIKKPKTESSKGTNRDENHNHRSGPKKHHSSHHGSATSSRSHHSSLKSHRSSHHDASASLKSHRSSHQDASASQKPSSSKAKSPNNKDLKRRSTSSDHSHSNKKIRLSDERTVQHNKQTGTGQLPSTGASTPLKEVDMFASSLPKFKIPKLSKPQVKFSNESTSKTNSSVGLTLDTKKASSHLSMNEPHKERPMSKVPERNSCSTSSSTKPHSTSTNTKESRKEKMVTKAPKQIDSSSSSAPKQHPPSAHSRSTTSKKEHRKGKTHANASELNRTSSTSRKNASKANTSPSLPSRAHSSNKDTPTVHSSKDPHSSKEKCSERKRESTVPELDDSVAAEMSPKVVLQPIKLNFLNRNSSATEDDEEEVNISGYTMVQRKKKLILKQNIVIQPKDQVSSTKVVADEADSHQVSTSTDVYNTDDNAVTNEFDEANEIDADGVDVADTVAATEAVVVVDSVAGEFADESIQSQIGSSQPFMSDFCAQKNDDETKERVVQLEKKIREQEHEIERWKTNNEELRLVVKEREKRIAERDSMVTERNLRLEDRAQKIHELEAEKQQQKITIDQLDHELKRFKQQEITLVGLLKEKADDCTQNHRPKAKTRKRKMSELILQHEKIATMNIPPQAMRLQGDARTSPPQHRYILPTSTSVSGATFNCNRPTITALLASSTQPPTFNQTVYANAVNSASQNSNSLAYTTQPSNSISYANSTVINSEAGPSSSTQTPSTLTGQQGYGQIRIQAENLDYTVNVEQQPPLDIIQNRFGPPSASQVVRTQLTNPVTMQSESPHNATTFGNVPLTPHQKLPQQPVRRSSMYIRTKTTPCNVNNNYNRDSVAMDGVLAQRSRRIMTHAPGTEDGVMLQQRLRKFHAEQLQQQQQQLQQQQQQQQQQQHPQQESQQQQQQQQQQPNYTSNVPQHTQSHNQQPPMAVPSPGPVQIQSTSPPQTQQQQRQPTPPQQTLLNSDSNSEKPSATKSTLNVNAKPFTPRNPSTPNPSRPHTPQTPQQSMPQGTYPQPQQQHIAQQMMVPATYIMQQSAAFQAPQHPHATQQTRFRKSNNYVQVSQMQVAAAAGQPLLAPAPIQQFVPFPAQHPQHFQSQGYPQMVYKQIRMFNETTQQPPIQYLTPSTPSTTPSPGQPHQQHQQYHIPQPSPAGGGPQYQATSQAPQFQMMCPLITAPLQQYYQGGGQPQHHPPQFQVLMSQQHPAQ